MPATAIARPRRTVAFLHLARPNGAEISLREQLAWLAEAGEVELVRPSDEWSATAAAHPGETLLPYAPVVLPRGAAEPPRLARRLGAEVRMFRRFLRDRQPDLVVVSTTTIPPALIAARSLGIPSVVRVSEIYKGRSATGRRRTGLGKGLIRLTDQLADAVVCSGEAVAQQFRGPSGGSPFVAYPSIRTFYGEGSGPRFRSAHGIATDAFVIASVGSISRGRGQDLAVDALLRIRRRVPEAVLVIAGEPHPREVDLAFFEEVHRRVADLGLSDSVRLVGYREDVGDLYAASNVIVNPARVQEAFGRVACEGLIAGTPAVSTRVGGVPEVLRHEEHALLVEPDDSAAIAEAVLRLYCEPELRQRIASRGREHVRQHFGVEQAVGGFASAVEASLTR